MGVTIQLKTVLQCGPLKKALKWLKTVHKDKSKVNQSVVKEKVVLDNTENVPKFKDSLVLYSN